MVRKTTNVKSFSIMMLFAALILLAGCSNGSDITDSTNNIQNKWNPSNDIKMKKLVFSLPDMDEKMCETFPRVVINSLEGMPGVVDASFEYEGHVVTVYFDSLAVKRDDLLNNEAYAWIGIQFISEDKSNETPLELFELRSANNPTTMPGNHMTEIPLPEKGYNDVSAIEFQELIQDNNVFVLDVHIPEQKHIPGTDALIPFDTISDNMAKLPSDKNTIIAIYCRSGSMSKIASEELVKLGYTNVHNLIGGINEWKMEGFSVDEGMDNIEEVKE